jgi:tetratricopeptide (TPR) repeat protein
MKKIVAYGFMVIGMLALASCASTGGAGAGISLETAIEQAAVELEAGHAPGVKIAVVSIASNSIDLSDYIIEELIGKLVKGKKLVVVDRQHLQDVLKELDFQMSGYVSDESAQSIGRMLGAQAVVTGNFTEAGAVYRFRVFSINVESAVRETAAMFDVRKDQRVRSLLHEIAVASPSSTRRNATYYFNEAGIAADAGDYDQAIRLYTQVLSIHPDEVAAYGNRGIAYGNKGDYDRAIADFNQAIRLDPNDAKSYYNRGHAYDDKGDYDRAIADYTQAIRLDPNYAAAYYNRGASYEDKKDYDRAIADYTQAIRLDPNFAAAYYNRGNAYKDKGDLNNAIADWEACLRIDPNDADAKNNLDVARKKRGW